MRKGLGADVTEVATSHEKGADAFRTALVHTYSACYGAPCEYSKSTKTSFVAPEDKFDLVASYTKQPSRVGLERLSSEVMFHETSQKRKIVVRKVLKAQRKSPGDAELIAQSVSPLTRSSRLFAHVLAKALHASVHKK